MFGVTELSITMPPALQHWVDTRLAQGRYAGADEYLRDLVRRDQETAEEETIWLKTLIEEGLASGIVDAEPEDVIEEIIARYPASNG